MKTKLISIFIIASLFAMFGTAHAVPTTDVKDGTNNIAGVEWFVPTDAQKNDTPDWWRDRDSDWGWQHNAIAGSFTSVVLDISAYDVDYDCSSRDCERDMISVFDGTDWVDLGNLDGSNQTWEFTTFDLSGYSWIDDQVNSGLQVRVDIDTLEGSTYWLLTLGKSTLTVDGGDQICVPTPGIPCVSVPAPAPLALLALGLLGLGVSKRKNIAQLIKRG